VEVERDHVEGVDAYTRGCIHDPPPFGQLVSSLLSLELTIFIFHEVLLFICINTITSSNPLH
jgi:hypothetical protein